MIARMQCRRGHHLQSNSPAVGDVVIYLGPELSEAPRPPFDREDYDLVQPGATVHKRADFLMMKS